MLSNYLKNGTVFPWRKKGLVYEPNMEGWTHGSHSCALHLQGNEFLIAFTSRDLTRRSHIFLATATITTESLIFTSSPQLALYPGPIGTFDCDGVISVCFVKHHSNIYLYYVGWQNLPEGLWICDTGRALVDVQKLTLRKEFEGPVLGRDKQHPLFAAATAFYIKDDLWHTWYNSGIAWSKTESGWSPRYGIHHATSSDGVHWNCEPGLVIPFKDEHEYAFGRPSVLFEDGIFYMWFAHRASATIAQYRIGFASSVDGITWTRADELAGIDVSENGWDSEMVCYPYLFTHKKKVFMLYNGNAYGKTGFGMAVLEEHL
jgi:hypothetical protein